METSEKTIGTHGAYKIMLSALGGLINASIKNVGEGRARRHAGRSDLPERVAGVVLPRHEGGERGVGHGEGGYCQL